MLILCLNCGSSSVKYRLYDCDAQKPLANGAVERVTVGGSFICHEVPGHEKLVINRECPDHKTAIKLVMDTLVNNEHGVIDSTDRIGAVGHRVVHGGEKFAKSVIIDDAALEAFRQISDLAPLHNPPNLMGIEAARELMPEIQHMAIMDTAWHQTMPPHAYLYALPYEWYEKYGIRRYGFHGTSFLYNAKRAAALLGKKPQECNLIICHIGNGASVNAVKNGKSYDTSMGLTPLEGLVMGTRAGDHDAAIGYYMMRKENLTAAQMENILNKKSGVYGITSKFTDRRDIEDAAAAGDKRCQLSVEIEGYRIKKYIGAYAAALGGVDAIIFTAGVGEMDSGIRERALSGLEFMGVKIDAEKNRIVKTRNAETEISVKDSKVRVFVIPTDEEMVFVEDVLALGRGTYTDPDHFTYSFQSAGYRNSLRDEGFEKDLKKRPGLKDCVAHPPKAAKPAKAAAKKKK
ncbi:MAG: acetate kinase [Elusimicrobia bacterium]|nr:acetate kinase [Elusimicrobiota bacterium]